MASETEICNLALSYLGQKPITNLMNPQTHVDQICALNYRPAKDAVLEAHNWTFAIKRVTLSTPLVQAPEWGFAYAYQLPTDVFRVIWCGRTPNEKSYDQFDWRVEDQTLVTDEPIVYVRYVSNVENPDKFSPLFVQALACRLAMEMCIAITESGALYDRLAQTYGVKIAEAVGNNGSQGRSQVIKQRILSNAR
jgi:hypothetical protein